jgi:hypothetical protein
VNQTVSVVRGGDAIRAFDCERGSVPYEEGSGKDGVRWGYGHHVRRYEYPGLLVFALGSWNVFGVALDAGIR